MTSKTPWCCSGHVSECPLCPEYGTRMIDPCPGHPPVDVNQQTVDTARLHAEFRHPDYEYATTRGPRKQWDDPDRPPAGENSDPDHTWSPNVDAGMPGMGWERFEYHEEAYWRRPKARSGPRETDGNTDQPRTEVNRYTRLSPFARALVDDHDAIALAELLVKAHDDLERARRELADRDAADSADTVAGSYAGSSEHAIADPARWLHILFTSPDETTANTSALAIRDHLAAEFPGVSMRISSNAVEGEAGRQIMLSSPPICGLPHQTTAEEDECERERHGAAPSCSPGAEETEPNNPAATEATGLRTRIARALREHGMVHLGDQAPADEYDCCADAAVDAIADQLEIGEEQAWCKTCRRAWNSPAHRCESDAEQQVQRIAELHGQWVAAGPPPLGVPAARWWDRRLVELGAAVRGPAEQPAPRDPCPHCESSPARIPRDQLGQHIAEQHPEVKVGA